MVSTPTTPKSAKNSPRDPARRRLIDAGIKMFAEKGFDGTTTRDIANEVGLSPASLYVHFASKEELLYVIALAGHRYVNGLVDEALAVSDDPAEQLGELVQRCVAGHLERHRVALVINNEIERLGPDHQAEILAMRAEVTARIIEVLTRGTADGVLSVDDPQAAAVAVSSLISDACRWYRPADIEEVAALAQQYRGLVLAMVGHRAAAAA